MFLGYARLLFISFLFVFLTGCVNDLKKNMQLKDKIDQSKIIKDQKKQITKTIEAGPKLNNENSKDLKDSRIRISDNRSSYSEDYFSSNSNEKLFINLKGADVRAFAEAISKVTNKNIIIGKEVDSTIRARLSNINVAGAFDIILSSHGLYQVTDKNLLVLSIHNPEVAKAMEIENSEKIKRKTVNSVTEVFRIHYADLEILKNNIIEIFSKVSSEDTANSIH